MAKLLTTRSHKRREVVESSPPDLSAKYKLAQTIRVWDSFIATAARDGKSYMQISYPDSDDEFNALVAHYTKKGFRVKEFDVDQGYCIGDVTKVQVDW